MSKQLCALLITLKFSLQCEIRGFEDKCHKTLTAVSTLRRLSSESGSVKSLVGSIQTYNNAKLLRFFKAFVKWEFEHIMSRFSQILVKCE